MAFRVFRVPSFPLNPRDLALEPILNFTDPLDSSLPETRKRIPSSGFFLGSVRGPGRNVDPPKKFPSENSDSPIENSPFRTLFRPFSPPGRFHLSRLFPWVFPVYTSPPFGKLFPRSSLLFFPPPKAHCTNSSRYPAEAAFFFFRVDGKDQVS